MADAITGMIAAAGTADAIEIMIGTTIETMTAMITGVEIRILAPSLALPTPAEIASGAVHLVALIVFAS